ncbi:hypothetical protein D917_04114 [Trichinella nativa]|uniref:Trimeric intracellular cation channel type B-A n=1 Tax=Trichinella nativa TaxID=6335 RepID=A0A1Y3E971_9BILA|nr:Trimeric intracellular cation channel type B-A [Trichinella sp. T6]KRZ85143.1 Trimeric intracellular cation channel type B-A [Trichinella sp. T8]OUC40386.1 hypothetical protein D917_04114 [Trichinella nativa]
MLEINANLLPELSKTLVSLKLYPYFDIAHYIMMTMSVREDLGSGAGSGIIRTFEQLVRGSWSPLTNEFLRPSLATKSCIVASVIFILEKMNMIPLPHEAVYTVVVSFFIHFKLSSFVLGIHDPFLPFENLFCAIFMGGIWDALNRAVTTSRERRAGMQSTSEQQQNATLNREAKKEQ